MGRGDGDGDDEEDYEVAISKYHQNACNGKMWPGLSLELLCSRSGNLARDTWHVVLFSI